MMENGLATTSANSLGTPGCNHIRTRAPVSIQLSEQLQKHGMSFENSGLLGEDGACLSVKGKTIVSSKLSSAVKSFKQESPGEGTHPTLRLLMAMGALGLELDRRPGRQHLKCRIRELLLVSQPHREPSSNARTLTHRAWGASKRVTGVRVPTGL